MSEKDKQENGSSDYVDESEASTSASANYSHVEEETSPDLLKNTPSNIARLEDVIEQCKARQKYLARTKSPSDGEDVRWYFCKVPLAERELSAAVPRTEIVGKSDYFRFSRRDSLALEASFLQREEELLAYWWKEYAECSEGPSGSRSASKDTESDDLYQVEEERVGVPVKGGLYEVNLMRRHCFPVYWNGENRRVLRGHWYAKAGPDWIPLREDVSEQLELAYQCQVWHRRKFQPSGQFAARVDLLGTSQGSHALFTGEDGNWEALLVHSGGNSVKLRRGFSSSGSSKPTQDELRQQKEEEMDDYCSQVPVGHLVFMIHGIGQRLEKANLVDDVVDFRRVTTSLAERHLTPYQRSTQRVLFIPCQWRKALRLSGESAVEKITLDGVRGLRVALGATVHDVLYYMSPIYCQQIIDSVSSQLNTLYMKFLKRNPGYSGKVSLYGHSLGSVLSYDILCHQNRLISPFPIDTVTFEAVNDQGDDVVSGLHQSDLSTSPPEKVDRDMCHHVSFSDEIVTDDLKLDNGETSHALETELEGEKLENGEHISSLEEVKMLKARIAQLEQGEEPKSENKQSILRKVSKVQNDKEISYKPYIRYTKLDFKVDTFYAVGSPLGVFLALRNVRIGIGQGHDYWQDEKIQEEMPSCRQMFNIFHPFDPVAYRIEPLVCEEYTNIRPVIIPYHRGGKRLHVGFQEFKEEIATVSNAVATHVSSLKEKAINVLQPKGKDTIEEKPESFHKKERSYGSLMMERLTGSEGGRIDHVLQLFYERDPIEEETPLTFSDRVAVKFSSKAISVKIIRGMLIIICYASRIQCLTYDIKSEIYTN
ncbi:Phospholipase SGR2 [Carex littledalei]|uniref:Phospholipase SGR2 n=1 Tax=Carex littledalei TaxID=544730 RepID=A0A833VK07_9POAL|nr:Phospholipase SGR2 [Carex littledalei]